MSSLPLRVHALFGNDSAKQLGFILSAGSLRPLFTQERVARSAGDFLDGLLVGQRAAQDGPEAAGDADLWRQQAILGRGRWDADALRDSQPVLLCTAPPNTRSY